MIKHLVALTLGLGACTPIDAPVETVDRLVVFGDSLSDPGNLFAITSTIDGIEPSPPSPPYDRGRFSNGPVWTEYLATELGLEATVVRHLAVGGARTDGHSLLDEVPEDARAALRAAGVGGVRQQVDAYLQDAGPLSPDGFYVLWAGANDYFEGETQIAADGIPVPVAHLEQAITDLADAGARTFLVPNLPDLGATPATQGNNATAALLTRATANHNAALSSRLLALAAARDLRVIELDIAAYFERAGAFGFADLRAPCIEVPGTCNRALFFDGVHPTTAAHAQIAELAQRRITAAGSIASRSW